MDFVYFDVLTIMKKIMTLAFSMLFAAICFANDDVLTVAEPIETLDSIPPIEMVFVEGGSFQMGATSEQDSDASGDEKPVHTVTVSSFYIGKTEVTQELWESVMGSNPSYFNKGGDYPVEQVSWDNIQEFLRKLNAATGKQYRLPTEAEWEYAACGGNKSQGYKYSGSNDIETVAVYEKNSYALGKHNSAYGTHPVASKAPNELGIYDMSGNVSEWCQDLYGNYTSSSQTNPQGASSGSFRVHRGGNWLFGAECSRVSHRNRGITYNGINLNGFRLVLLP